MFQQSPKSHSYRGPVTFSTLFHTGALALLVGLGFLPVFHKTISISTDGQGPSTPVSPVKVRKNSAMRIF